MRAHSEGITQPFEVLHQASLSLLLCASSLLHRYIAWVAFAHSTLRTAATRAQQNILAMKLAARRAFQK